MMSTATFVALEEHIPAPEDVGIHYTYQDDDILKNLLESKALQDPAPRSSTSEGAKGKVPPNSKLNSRIQVTFEPLGNKYECSLVDLTKIIHYIFDLFSTDYQYHLVRSIFTFPPDYIHIDAPYQIQVPKQLYTAPKTGKEKKGKSPRKEKSPKKEKKEKKGPKEKIGKQKKEEEPPPQDYIDLMELKAKEQEIEAQEAIEREVWHRKRSILPLNGAVDSEFLNKYWQPPEDGADSSPRSDKSDKGKKKGKGKKK